MGKLNLFKLFIFSIFISYSFVATSAVKSAGWGLDGLWYNPSQDGQGFDVKFIQRADGQEELVMAWYTFDQTGSRQAWLYSQGTLTGNTATLTAYAVTNGVFNNSTPVVKTTVGSITMQVNTCDSANISWSLNAPQIGITSSGFLPLTRLSPLAQHNGIILCSGEPSGLAQSDDMKQVIPIIGNGRVMIQSQSGQLLINERSHDQGVFIGFDSRLDDCIDTSYSATCSAYGTPYVSVRSSIDKNCLERKTFAYASGNPISISDVFYAYLTDGRVRVHRTSDNILLADERSRTSSAVEVSNTVAGFITDNRVRFVNKDGTLLADENASNNARVAVSDTMYAYVSGNLFRVFRTKDNSKVFEVGIDNDPGPIIRVTNNRAYFFGTRSGGWVVNYDGTWVARN